MFNSTWSCQVHSVTGDLSCQAQQSDLLLSPKHVIFTLWEPLLHTDSPHVHILENQLDMKWFKQVGEVEDS